LCTCKVKNVLIFAPRSGKRLDTSKGELQEILKIKLAGYENSLTFASHQKNGWSSYEGGRKKTKIILDN